MRDIIFALVIFHFFHGCVPIEIDCKKPDWFKCDNGRCISHFFECDGENECGDFSDEKNCTGFKFKPDEKCSSDEFRCLDNMCIPEDSVCDGNNDCMDSSDEILGCTKNKKCDGFKCKNGYCILTEWKCDGSNDCGDNSDETDCFHKLTPEECIPEKGYFTCGSKECISLMKACDGTKDCPDGSDENADECKTAEQQCASRVCNQICHKTPKGAVCSCQPGYKLLGERNCVDIDECANYGICDQNCENLNGTYDCSCEEGYLLQNDSRTCKADGGEALMVYSSKTDIRGLYLTSQVMFYVARKLQHVVGVSIDSEHVYWSNVQLGNEVIARSKEDGSQQEIIITAGLGAPEDIAVDWVTGNVYFTDGQMKHIGVCTENGSSCTVIITENADKPRGISLLPSKGEMYWSDWGEHPHISKAHMDGKNITPFITENIVWPNGLTIDYQSHRLYWVDAKRSTIETVKLDGSDRRIVLHEVARHPYSIAIFENKLYWSDWKTNSVKSCNKFTGKGRTTIVKEKKSIYGIHIYHSTLKPTMQNPCSHGFCSDICMLAPNATYSCGCPADKELGIDQHSCRVTEKEKRIMVGAGHMFITVHHEILGKPKLLGYLSMYQDITALAYDPETGNIFASDRIQNIIFRYDPRTQESANLITTKLGHVGGMDFDRFGRNLYWCDTIRKNIEVYSIHTGERMTLNEEQLDDVPLDLAVIPEYGLLYVVFKSTENIHIDKMQMSGHGSKTHVIESGLLGPSVALAYDAHLARIFWADEGTGMIESTSFDGRDRHQFRSKLNSPMSLAIVGNDIFWTSYGSIRLYWADKTGEIPGEKKIPLGLPMNTRTMHLAAMGGNFEPAHHPCLVKNGGCSHICLVVSNQQSTCACPKGMMLDHDNYNCVSHKSCKIYEKRCDADKSCIDKSKWCDGFKDCPSGEDEWDCAKSVICGFDHFACKNGECVHKSKLCDSNYDCVDRSDEDDCSSKSCDEDEFQCGRGNCISKYYVCDGRKNCIDGSDEENCQVHTCDPNISFACKNGGCIPRFWECDGQVDCGDGSDESGQCGNTTCSPKMFTCQNSRCIDTVLVCNLIDDCGDGSDERRCSKADEDDVLVVCGEDEFKCLGTNKCLSISAKCDGVIDCPSKDDELRCTDCESDDFTCSNKKCIPRAWVCDRTDDCGDKSDEKNCESQIAENHPNEGKGVHCKEYKCQTGTCLPYSAVCDGNVDCFDHSDEDGNCDTSCGSTNPCQGICNKTPSGPICSCAEGFKLQNDGFSCEDIDECKLGMCSQICHNTIGSYSCSCFNGFYGDGRVCKATGAPMEMIVATRDDIRKISQSLKSVEVIYTEPDFDVGINGIDLNIARKMVYWSMEKTGTIFQLSLETMETKNVTKIGNPRVLSVDWTTDNVYFYDSGSPHSIKVCNLEERKCANVISVTSANKVNALAVDPKHGFIFWGQTESWSYNGPAGEIYRAKTTGQNRTLIAAKKIGSVSGLAIDHSRGRLYWADNHLQLIESSDLNGNDRRIVFDSNVHRPVGLSLFEDSLFWLTPGTGQMTICSLFGANQACKRTQISSSFNEQQFAIMHQTRQPAVDNVCQDHKCSYMCVINNEEVGCLCQNGTVVSLGEKCINVTTLSAEFGQTDKVSSRSDGSYFSGVASTIFICLILLSGYYCYQQRQKETSKCDLSIHFQNPTFGTEPDPLMNSGIMPSGEHEYVNPIIDIHSKIPRRDAHVKRTLKLIDSEDIITSESEDGNDHPHARLID